MKRKLKTDENNHPVECPNQELCDSEMDDPISISNIDGFECVDCGCWFDTDEAGNVLWAYDEVPNPL